MSDDCAWVRIVTPLILPELYEFCSDIERLYRINPLLEFREWQSLSSERYRFQVYNLSNQQILATEIYVEKGEAAIKITYREGLKVATLIKLEAAAQGSVLTLLDDYSRCSEEERKRRLAEVDKSLTQWGQAIYRYLQQWQRWSWLPVYRWYKLQIWQPLTPVARRITYILIVITFFEILAFLLTALWWSTC